MPATSPEQLVASIRGGTFLIRVGVLFASPVELQRGSDIAARLGVESIDYVSWTLDRLGDDRRSLGFDASAFLRDMDMIAAQASMTRCLLLWNIDILVSRLSESDRRSVWSFLYDGFKRRQNALIVLMPLEAPHLFSSDVQHRWEDAGRVAYLEPDRSVVYAGSDW